MKHAILLAVLIFSGCASTEFNPAPGAPDLGPYQGEVRVLDRFPPQGSYRQLGIVIAHGVFLTEKEELIDDARAAAAKRGANAVVLQGGVKVRKRADGREVKKLGAYAIRVAP